MAVSSSAPVPIPNAHQHNLLSLLGTPTLGAEGQPTHHGAATTLLRSIHRSVLVSAEQTYSLDDRSLTEDCTVVLIRLTKESSSAAGSAATSAAASAASSVTKDCLVTFTRVRTGGFYGRSEEAVHLHVREGNKLQPILVADPTDSTSGIIDRDAHGDGSGTIRYIPSHVSVIVKSGMASLTQALRSVGISYYGGASKKAADMWILGLLASAAKSLVKPTFFSGQNNYAARYFYKEVNEGAATALDAFGGVKGVTTVAPGFALRFWSPFGGDSVSVKKRKRSSAISSSQQQQPAAASSSSQQQQAAAISSSQQQQPAAAAITAESSACGTTQLLRALAMLGVQLERPAVARSKTVVTAAQSMATSEAVAAVSAAGENAGVKFTLSSGTEIALPRSVFYRTLSCLAGGCRDLGLMKTLPHRPSVSYAFRKTCPLLNSVPRVSKGWLAAAVDPRLFERLDLGGPLPAGLGITALCRVMRQPKFLSVRALVLGDGIKLGKTGAASLGKVGGLRVQRDGPASPSSVLSAREIVLLSSSKPLSVFRRRCPFFCLFPFRHART